MTRKEFTTMLLDNHISSVGIIRVPDYEGGYFFKALLNMSMEEIYEWLENKNFTFLEWYGDVSDAARHHNMIFYSHVEVFHEEPKDYPDTMEELIIPLL